jgi:hypothetical protein
MTWFTFFDQQASLTHRTNFTLGRDRKKMQPGVLINNYKSNENRGKQAKEKKCSQKFK